MCVWEGCGRGCGGGERREAEDPTRHKMSTEYVFYQNQVCGILHQFHQFHVFYQDRDFYNLANLEPMTNLCPMAKRSEKNGRRENKRQISHETDKELSRMPDLRRHCMVEATVSHVGVELLHCLMELHRWGEENEDRRRVYY